MWQSVIGMPLLDQSILVSELKIATSTKRSYHQKPIDWTCDHSNDGIFQEVCKRLHNLSPDGLMQQGVAWRHTKKLYIAMHLCHQRISSDIKIFILNLYISIFTGEEQSSVYILSFYFLNHFKIFLYFLKSFSKLSLS